MKGHPLTSDDAADDEDIMTATMKSFDRNLVKTRTAARHRKMGWLASRAVRRNTDNHAVICSAV